MAYKPNDHYARKAKGEGYLARSVFKLQELDKKARLFRKGDHVLDLGASPGSWSQYAAQQVGPQGFVLGVDLTEMNLALPNAAFVQDDVYEMDLPALAQAHGLRLPVDLVISDMAPNTSGSPQTDHLRSHQLCEMGLHMAQQHLKPGGHYVCKFFDGIKFQPFRQALQAHFHKVQMLRPKSTRSSSRELFFMALNKKEG